MIITKLKEKRKMQRRSELSQISKGVYWHTKTIFSVNLTERAFGDAAGRFIASKIVEACQDYDCAQWEGQISHTTVIYMTYSQEDSIH